MYPEGEGGVGKDVQGRLRKAKSIAKKRGDRGRKRSFKKGQKEGGRLQGGGSQEMK